MPRTPVLLKVSHQAQLWCPGGESEAMDKALETAVSKAEVNGVLCADANGLLISAKGEIKGEHAGRYSSILRHASSLCDDQPAPTVVIETQSNSTIIRSYADATVVLKAASMSSSEQ